MRLPAPIAFASLALLAGCAGSNAVQQPLSALPLANSRAAAETIVLKPASLSFGLSTARNKLVVVTGGTPPYSTKAIECEHRRRLAAASSRAILGIHRPSRGEWNHDRHRPRCRRRNHRDVRESASLRSADPGVWPTVPALRRNPRRHERRRRLRLRTIRRSDASVHPSVLRASRRLG